MNVTVVAGSWPPRLSPRAIHSPRLVAQLNGPVEAIVPRFSGSWRNDVTGRATITERRVWNPRLRWTAAVMRRMGVDLDKIPDEQLPWGVVAGVAAGMSSLTSDLLLTISSPLSSHVAGLVAKCGRLRNTPWVGYFSDCWVGDPTAGLSHSSRAARWANDRMCAAVLEGMDAYAFPTRELADHFARVYPVVGKRPVGIASQAFVDGQYPQRSIVRSSPRELLVRFIGSMYTISPAPLLEGLEVLRKEAPTVFKRLRIEFYGTWTDVVARQREERWMAELGNVRHLGAVTYEESLRLMVESDVLLHIGIRAGTEYYRPSKLIDYLGANRPIALIAAPGAEERFAREVGALWVNSRDSGGIARMLSTYVDAKENGTLESLRADASARNRHSIEAVGADFRRFLDTVVAAGVSRLSRHAGSSA